MIRVKIGFLLLALLMSLLPVLGVNADGSTDKPSVEVSANISVPVTVDGRGTVDAVASAQIGSTICIGDNLVYTSTSERNRFQRWDYDPLSESPGMPNVDGLETTSLYDDCLVATQAGRYTATYVREVLFLVRSGVDAYKQSRWVEKGAVIDLAVPEVVGGKENVRYRFNGWNGGESPFTPKNRIAILNPTVLELGWTVEYNVKIEEIDGSLSPVSGWYSGNEPLLIRTPAEIWKNGGREKSTFQKWEVVYGPLLKRETNPNMAIIVDGPCWLRPIYTESFLVEVNNFQGMLSQEWVPAGEEAEIKAPALVEVSPDRERFVFKEWQGKEGLEGNELNLTVDESLALEAIYQRQFKLNVRSPYGASGDGWYDDGQKTVIMAPREPQSMLFFKRAFDGFLGYGDGTTPWEQPVTTVQVNEPMTVTAAYRSEINLKVLFLLVGVLVAGTLVYVGTEWGPKVYRRWRPQVAEVPAVSDEMKRLLV